MGCFGFRFFVRCSSHQNRVNIVLFILCGLVATTITANNIDYDITCKDENGKAVDWFYLYKLPGHFGSPSQSKGRLFLYFTANSVAPQWTLSDRTVDDPTSIPGHTIRQAYFNASEVKNERLVIAYNDEPPTKKSNMKKGHLKGLLVADEFSGFWLIHSVPLFPNITDNPMDYTYPATGTMYGQSFLCLSLTGDEINLAANQLIYNQPQIFVAKLTAKLNKKYPNVGRLLTTRHLGNGPYWSEVDLTTIGGTQFKSFAKSGEFGKELYEDWVAPVLNTDLYVESWRKGPGNFASNCTRSNRVWNISKVKINENYEFHTTDDHSKWGVSNQTSSWICVGDINRAAKQTQRGGGTVCQNSGPIADAYRTLITDYEQCGSGPLKRTQSLPDLTT